MANGWNNSTWGALGWSGILSSTVEVTSPGNDPWGSFGTSQYFQDSSGNNVSITNNNSVVGIQSNPFNLSSSGSLQFINAAYPNGEYLSATVPAPSTDSITYECWFYRTSATPVTQGILQTRTNTAGGDGIDVSVASNKITVSTSGAFLLSDAGPTQSLNTWYHIAVVRNGTTNFTVYLNGTSIGTFNKTGLTSTQLKLGLKSLTGSNEYFNGYISNFRYVKGTAVYTSDFTVPTAPLTAITNTQLLLNTASPSTAWGQKSFGGANSLTVSQNSVTVDAISLISVTGLQLNTSLNSVQAFGLAIVPVTGQQLNITEGDVDASPDAIVTGQQLNISLNSVTVLAEINSGWGRLTWGQNDWGSDGLSVITSVTGQQLNLTLNSVTPLANANVNLTGQQLNITEGEVDPSPDATVTGIGMTVGLAIGTVVIGTGNVTLTGQQINISQGTAIGDANTIASITGLRLNTSVGTVFAGTTSVIPVTGNGLTIALNSINNQIWTEINTGTDATWTEIDTAA
jgi:hypothetical protein